MSQQGPQDDLLARYLFEIRAFPLLSKADEQALGETIEDGRQAEQRLAERVENGDALAQPELETRVLQGRLAAEQLFRANLPLVVYVAKRYRRPGVALLDVIQDGNIGLLRAVEGFDHRRGVRFSTYATWWIRQSIRKGLTRNGAAIQLPLRLRDRLALVQSTESRLMLELGRVPTQEELGTELGLSRREIAMALTASVRPRSLAEYSFEGEADAELSEWIAEKGPGPEALAATAGDLARLLRELDERERQIVAMRYGLHGQHPLTLKEVGEALGLTGERVRQLEARAISKLREVAGGE